jgi:hypothetical protein
MKALACYLIVIALGVNLGLAAAEPTSAAKKDTPKSAEAAKGGDITDPKVVLAGISRDIMKDLRPGNREAINAVGKATAQVRTNAEGKPGKFTMTVTGVEKFQRKDTPDINRTRIKSNNTSVREGGATLRVYLMAAVADDAEKEKLARIKPGTKVTVSGVISNAEITMPRQEVELHIDIMDAKIE